MKHLFKFKQFEVDQSGCAMKINTDGVLLAALVQAKADNTILDVGTGTGVIALMLAQRFSMAKVTAVEIDKDASMTAQRNFQSSKFSDRLSALNTPIENFNSEERFDLIVSNPPFFVNDYKNAEPKKEQARHASNQFFVDLLDKVNELLTDNGSFWFVLPINQAALLIKEAEAKGLFLSGKIALHSDQSKPAFRWIICLTRRKAIPSVTQFYIYQSEKVYTDAYKKLLADFFLAY
jgi:tRNA1Val (adenine37-N6)-methyltransferase